MNIDKQIVSAIEKACFSSSGDNVSAAVETVLSNNKEICERLEVVISDFENEQIQMICPVVVNRNDRLTLLQRLLESPICSCGWLVAMNTRVIYEGIISKGFFHSWGSLSKLAQAPDNSVFLLDEIEGVEFEDGCNGGAPRLGIKTRDGKKWNAKADAEFGDSLQSISRYIKQRIEG